MNNKVILLLGPTASGKTDLAMSISDKFTTDIISVDSAMIYKGMDIGTSKPSRELLRKYPHALVDIIEPHESYSVGRFSSDVKDAIETTLSNNRVPILVGGTMMYFNALLNGLDTLPESDPRVREKLEFMIKDKGLAYMHSLLVKVDPESGARIHPNDPQRIQRALEVYYSSGSSITSYYGNAKQALLSGYDVLPLVINVEDRKVLHDRIARRFHTMLEQGFIEEVQKLLSKSTEPNQPQGLRSVGYSQAWSYLQGEYNYDKFVDKSIIATRQLAKRQITWLRKIANDFLAVNHEYSTKLHDNLSDFLSL